jgi:hypothetical protein
VFHSALAHALLWKRGDDDLFVHAAMPTTPIWSWAPLLGGLDLKHYGFDPNAAYARVQAVTRADILTSSTQIHIRGPTEFSQRTIIREHKNSIRTPRNYAAPNSSFATTTLCTSIPTFLLSCGLLCFCLWSPGSINGVYTGRRVLILVVDSNDEKHYCRVGCWAAGIFEFKRVHEYADDKYKTVILL